MLPAYIANALPVVSNHFDLLKNLAVPIDRGIMLNDKPLFGHSKTIRGFIFGVSGAVLIGLIQFFLRNIESIHNISLIDYNLGTSLALGFLLGFGALLGDLIESFFKRRFSISSGSSWIIADQVDYVIGALILASPMIVLNTNYIIAIFILSGILAITSNIIAYFIGMKDVWW